MASIAVLYHSGYGHTQRLAQAVADGAGATLIAIDADGELPDGGWDTLDGADAIVFGSPTYMGGASWQFKKVADASSKQWFSGAWKDKLFAGFTNSAQLSGDKESTLGYFCTLALQHGGLWVGTAMTAPKIKAAQRDDLNYLGAYSGVMTQSPADASPAEMAPGDLETGRRFGQRIAEVAARLAP